LFNGIHRYLIPMLYPEYNEMLDRLFSVCHKEGFGDQINPDQAVSLVCRQKIGNKIPSRETLQRICQRLSRPIAGMYSLDTHQMCQRCIDEWGKATGELLIILD
jgi:hypothetical protein